MDSKLETSLNNLKYPNCRISKNDGRWIYENMDLNRGNVPKSCKILKVDGKGFIEIMDLSFGNVSNR